VARRSATRSSSWSCCKPRFAFLDETDSGLDVDALRIVSEGVNRAQEANPTWASLLITHYTRILRYIKPDHVHVFVDGRIAEEGGPELADRSRTRATTASSPRPV
jgi:Fe-S cluster assembly ATP-binding protein